MTNTTIYECAECHRRLMVKHKQQLPPTIYCDCGEFAIMDVKEQR